MVGFINCAIMEQNLRRGPQVEISRMLGCSTRTIHRRIVEFGLDRFIQYSVISEVQLDELVANFVANFPTAGQKTLAGHLSTLGYRTVFRDTKYGIVSTVLTHGVSS